MRNKLKDTLLRMAQRLFAVTVVTGLTRWVMGGPVTVSAAIAMLVAITLVVGLLVAAHLLKD